jgi:hypothetical protein
MTARALSIDLDLPSSVNASFANVPGRGRVFTTAYRSWRKQALAEIRAQARGVRFAGIFRISVSASDQALSRNRDADNPDRWRQYHTAYMRTKRAEAKVQ